jgi:xanthine dehydrogenase accessory factor
MLPSPRTADPAEVLAVVAEAAARGVAVAVATVLARRGSSPSTPGQKLSLASDGTCVGTVGGGAVERAVLEALSSMLSDPEGPLSRIETHRLGPELGMCCGGAVDVFLERVVGSTPALVVGAGHIGAIVAPLLAQSGFAVTLVDEREEWIARTLEKVGRSEAAPTRLRGLVTDHAVGGHDLPRSAAVLVMTHDHALDQEVVEWALREGFAFVGGVGSRAKAARTRARLEAKGFPEGDRARIRMPLGLSIGARAPHEIAIAIVAELIAWRRTGRTAGPP